MSRGKWNLKGHHRMLGLFALPLLSLAGCLPGPLEHAGSLAFLNLTGPGLSEAFDPGAFAFVSSSPLSGYVLGTATVINLLFSDALVPGSCQESGTLGPASLSYNGPIVSVSPTGGWNSGFGLTLELNGCTEVGSDQTAGASLSFQVGGGQMYISPAGMDGNPGTAAAPKLSLNGALSVCGGPCTVFASEGTYQPEAVSVPTSFALIGGYAAGYTIRNPSNHPTIFRDTSASIGSPGAPTSALRINAPYAYVEGIEVQASSSLNVNYAAGVWINGGTVVLDDVVAGGCGGTCDSLISGTGVYMDGDTSLSVNSSNINGGSCSRSGCSTAGLSDGAGTTQNITIHSSTLTGGTATGSSCGALLTTAKGAASSIQGSTISGGIAPNTVGLSIASFAGPVQQNFITGGMISSPGGSSIGVRISGMFQALVSNVVFGGSTGISGTTTAIDASGSTSTGQIYNNLMDAGNPGIGQTSVALRLSGNATPDVENNIFTGWSRAGSNYCIWYSGSASLANLMNNGFYNCNPAGRIGGTDYDTICAGSLYSPGCASAFPVTGANSGNVIATIFPGWISQDYASLTFDYHFRGDGSALCSFTQGGLAISSPEDDMDGTARTPGTGTGWSMGPYEYDGPCE